MPSTVALAIAWCMAAALLPLCAKSAANPFMFLLRSAQSNPVTYLHSGLVGQLISVPCFFENDGLSFGVSNQSDMAWYRRQVSTHSPRTFQSMTDIKGNLLILEPIIGYNWYTCDTAFVSKLNHAKKYEQFFRQFNMGQLNLDWNQYHDFPEFDKGQFKHIVFSNELSMTEMFVNMNFTLRKIKFDTTFDISDLAKPLQMGIFKLTLLRILESECRDNVEQYCENPTVDILLPAFDADGGITIQARVKLYLSNERILKLGADTFDSTRMDATRRNYIRWNMTSQSIDLGPLAALNPYPLTLVLIFSANLQPRSDCVGSGSYLSSKYDWQCVLCRPGYYLKNDPWIHAASEKNSICHLCPVGSYSATWGSTECHKCKDNYTTGKVGSTKYADCLLLSKYEMEIALQDLFDYFNVKNDYQKAFMLACVLITPWVLLIACLLVLLIYGHNEVNDLENRFQLEKELGTVILKIRRHYNVLLEESKQL